MPVKTTVETELLDRVADALFRLMLEHHQTCVTEMELTLSQAQTLKLLHGAALSTTGLAAALGISAPAVSQLTDRLVRKRLIERRAVETDRRSVTVELSRRGTEVIERFRRRRNEFFGAALSALGDPDRAAVVEILGKIAAALEGRGQPPSVAPAKLDRPKRIRRQSPESRTAVQPAGTSKVIRLEESSLPPKKRMKIEWD